MLRCIVSPIISVHMCMWENWYRSPTGCSYSDHVQLLNFAKNIISHDRIIRLRTFLGGYPFLTICFKMTFHKFWSLFILSWKFFCGLTIVFRLGYENFLFWKWKDVYDLSLMMIMIYTQGKSKMKNT